MRTPFYHSQTKHRGFVFICGFFLVFLAPGFFAGALAGTDSLWHITDASKVRLQGIYNIQRGSVLVDGDSLLSLTSGPTSPARLHISDNLTVGDAYSGAKVQIYGTLTVGGNLDLHRGSVANNGVLAIGGRLSSGVDGSLNLRAKSLTTFRAADIVLDNGSINTDNFAGCLTLENPNASLLLTGWHSKVISQQEYQKLLDTVGSITDGNILKKNNLALWGVSILQEDGSVQITKGSGVGHVLAGDRITMTRASKNQLWQLTAYVAPQIVLDAVSDTLSVGTPFDINASLTTVGLPEGTVNLVQNADGSVGNLRVAKGSSYTAGSGMASSGLLGHVNMAGTGIVNQGMYVGMESLNLAKGSLSVLGTDKMSTFVHSKILDGDQGSLSLISAGMSVDDLTNAVLRSKVELSEKAVLGIGLTQGSFAGMQWVQQQAMQIRGASPVTEILALGKSFTLESGNMGGQLSIGKSLDSSGTLSARGDEAKNGVYFGESSLLLIDATSPDIQNTVARGEGIIRIHNTDKGVYIADSSQLRIHGAKGNQNYIIISGTDGPVQGWSDAQISTNTDMLRGDSTLTEDKWNTHFSVNKASEIYKGLSPKMADIIESMYTWGANDLHSPHNGLRFLSRVTDNTNTYLTRGQEARLLEGAARLGTVAGVHATALAAADAGVAALMYRTSTSAALASWQLRSVFYDRETADYGPSPSPAGDNLGTESLGADNFADNSHDEDDEEPPSPPPSSPEPFTDELPHAKLTGISLWSMPLHQTLDSQNSTMGTFASGITSTMQGLVMGAEYDTGDNLLYGLSVNIGKGNSLSHGDFFSTKNTYDFYGTNAYASLSANNATLIGDAGLSHSRNTVRQHLPLLLDKQNLSANINTLVLNAGLRAEYTFRSPVLHITPHVGARFSRLYTGRFDSIHDQALFSTTDSLQNILTFPAGFTLNKSWQLHGDWLVQPYFSSGVILAKGDLRQSAQVSMPGLGTLGQLTADVVDPLSYTIGAGLQVQKKGLDFGLKYSLTAGKQSTVSQLFGTLSYTF